MKNLRHQAVAVPTRVECEPKLAAALDLMHRYRNDGSCEHEILEALLGYGELLEALRGILGIGKRNLENPKYDGYFEAGRSAIAKATRAARTTE